MKTAFYTAISFFGLLFFATTASAVSLAEELAMEQDIGGKISKAFDEGSLPTEADLNGYWAGRCVQSVEPDAVRPAVFVFKTITNSNEFPPIRKSFSYYYNSEWKSDTFDNWTPKQVDSYSELKSWWATEQWNPIQTGKDSIMNSYQASSSVKFMRSVRLYEDEFNNLIILRVTKLSGKKSEVSTHCYFHKHLGTAPVVPVEPVVGDFEIEIENGTSLKIPYSFRMSKDFDWSESVFDTNKIHVWRAKEVKAGRPEIEFDFSTSPGMQLRHYRLENHKRYLFVRTGTGTIDLRLDLNGQLVHIPTLLE